MKPIFNITPTTYVVFFSALSLRAIWFLIIYLHNSHGFFTYDSWGYAYIAHNLMEHGIYAQQIIEIPDTQRTPIYPFILYLFYQSGINEYGVLVLQLFLDSITCCIIAKIVKLLTDNKKATFIAGLLLAFHFPSILFSNTLLPEIPLNFLVSFSLLYFVKFLKSENQKHILYSGLLMGMAILCKPVVVYFPIGMGVFLLLKKTSAKKALLFIAVTYITVSPWALRNYSIFGRPFLSTVSEINFLFHTASNIRAIKEEKTLGQIQDEYWKISGQYDWKNPQQALEFHDFSRQEMFRVIKDNPIIFLKNYGGSFMLFFMKPLRNYIDVQLGIDHGYESISAVTDSGRFTDIIAKTLKKTSTIGLFLVVYQLLWLFIIWSAVLVAIAKQNTLVNWFLLFSVFYFAGICSITETDARLRLSAIPFMVILASIGVNQYRSFKPRM